MNTKIFLLLSVFFSLTLFGNLSAASEPDPALWMTDFNQASAAAKKMNRPMIVLFTGSDWCIWCKRLDREIWQTNEFRKWAEKNVITVKIDFPHFEEVPPQNRALAKKYRIQGYPTVVILSSEGRELGRTGYRKMSAGSYVSHLKTFCNKK